jgi:hypothetical protein
MPEPTRDEIVAWASNHKRSDGPLIEHPMQIADSSRLIELGSVDVTMSDHRLAEKERRTQLAACKPVIKRILDVIVMPVAIDMGQLLRKYRDEDIERLVERWYVHTELYVHRYHYWLN